MSDLVGNPEDRFSHSEAHLLICTCMSSSKIKKSARCCLLEWMICSYMVLLGFSIVNKVMSDGVWEYFATMK